jgi:hypothetical protein
MRRSNMRKLKENINMTNKHRRRILITLRSDFRLLGDLPRSLTLLVTMMDLRI